MPTTPQSYNPVTDVLRGLLQLGGRGLSEAGKKTGRYYMEYSPAALLGRLVAQASNIPAQQDLAASLKGTQTQKAVQSGQQPDPLKNLSPLQETTLKEVQKVRKQQVQEAAQSGVPLEHILDQAGMPIPVERPPFQMQESDLNQLLTSGTFPQQEQLQADQPAFDVEQAIENAYAPAMFGLLKPTPSTVTRNLANVGTIQQLLGQAPAQKGQKELLSMEGMYGLLGKAMSSGASDTDVQKTLQEGNSLLAMIDQVESLRSKAGRGGFGSIAKTLGLNPEASTYDDLIKAVATPIGRFIGEDRFTDQDRKVFKELFPSRRAFGGVSEGKFDAIRALIQAKMSASQSGAAAPGIGQSQTPQGQQIGRFQLLGVE